MLRVISQRHFRLSRPAVWGLLLLGTVVSLLPMLIPAAAVAQPRAESTPPNETIDPPQREAAEHPAAEKADDKWGDLVGRFLFEGDQPVQKPITISKDKEVFERYGIVDESLLIDAKGGIKNVVIYTKAENIPIHASYSKPSPKNARIRVVKGQFQPRIVPVWVGKQELALINSGPAPVSFHFQPFFAEQFNFLAPSRSSATRKIKNREPYPAQISCDIHPWMKAFILPRKTPYTAVSKSDGRFQLKKLPVGELEFVVWHEASGKVFPDRKLKKKLTIEIKPGMNDLGTIKIKAARFGR